MRALTCLSFFLYSFRQAVAEGSRLTLRTLVLQVNGQQFRVDTERRAGGGPAGPSPSTRKDGAPEFVDVEIL